MAVAGASRRSFACGVWWDGGGCARFDSSPVWIGVVLLGSCATCVSHALLERDGVVSPVAATATYLQVDSTCCKPEGRQQPSTSQGWPINTPGSASGFCLVAFLHAYLFPHFWFYSAHPHHTHTHSHTDTQKRQKYEASGRAS